MDIQYYSSDLAVRVRAQFGVLGITVFDAFLRACKRNPVEGEITYSTVDDFLAQIGLPALRLVDETGTEWSLDALWTLLGRYKNVRRTSRGQLTNVRSTRWERWQTRRSPPRNTTPIRRDAAVYKDKDRDKDIDSQSSSSSVSTDAAPQAVDDDELWMLVAQRKLARQAAGSVRNPARWLAKVAAEAKGELGERAAELVGKFDVPPSMLADVLADGGQVPQSWTHHRRP